MTIIRHTKKDISYLWPSKEPTPDVIETILKEKISKKALNNTYYSVSVYDENKIIGYGRLIGDGICFMHIHDVMVIPEYQNKRIGTRIVNKLLEKIKEIKKENPDVRVYLGASKGKEGFYKNFGFIERQDADLGAGMIYNK